MNFFLSRLVSSANLGMFTCMNASVSCAFHQLSFAFYAPVKGMCKHCCVSWSSGISKDNVPLFQFPQMPKLRAEVQRTCDKWAGPDKYSDVCSVHFEEDEGHIYQNTKLR